MKKCFQNFCLFLHSKSVSENYKFCNSLFEPKAQKVRQNLLNFFEIKKIASYNRMSKISIINLENYEFLEVIGKGSFGKVRKVREKGTNNIYAAKTMKELSISFDKAFLILCWLYLDKTKLPFSSIKNISLFSSHIKLQWVKAMLFIHFVLLVFLIIQVCIFDLQIFWYELRLAEPACLFLI